MFWRTRTASSVEWKEQTIRRSEGRGEKELSGAMSFILERMVARDEGWKMCKSLRSVIKRVFDGGDGCDSGGRLDRSSDKDGLEVEEDREEWVVDGMEESRAAVVPVVMLALVLK